MRTDRGCLAERSASAARSAGNWAGVYLRRLGARWLKPRPRHVQADPQAQAEFKRHLRPLLREVATAFPQATVELWAVDEHRIGLKPILNKVWIATASAPSLPSQHRYEWRYLVGFVHPASGRTVFHLATTVSIAPVRGGAGRICAEVGASPTKQIVLVLDRAGWHSTQACACPTTSTCSSCRPTRPNSSRLSICGH